MMKTVDGDLIEMALRGRFEVIVHGCNCFHTMGAGIAKAIATNFPEALAADQDTEYGSHAKLGTISIATIERGGTVFTIVNAYTQFKWRGRGRKVDYDAVEACFREVADAFGDRRIAYPAIGAGLAGGDWSVIEGRISAALYGCDHTLVRFSSS